MKLSQKCMFEALHLFYFYTTWPLRLLLDIFQGGAKEPGDTETSKKRFHARMKEI